MNRAALASIAAADRRQIAGLDLSNTARQIAVVMLDAISRTASDPELLTLDVNGLSAIELAVSRDVFVIIAADLWPDIVHAYSRGAKMPMKAKAPPDDADAESIAELLDSLGLGMIRANIHAGAWSIGTRTAALAARVLAQQGAA